MMNSISKYIFCGIIGIISFSSCDSYLDTVNEKDNPAHGELTTLSALEASTASLYTSPWYFFHKQRFIQLGDARANNLYISTSASNDYNAQTTFSETNENASLANAWGSLYNVITQAAYIIDDYAPYCVKQGVCSQTDANICIGEARFMRALAYWYLAMYWHDVPIVENATTISTMAYANKFEDVIQYAICEAEYAEKWLPANPYEKGRVSKISAQALLSRLYLTAGAYAMGGHFSSEFENSTLAEYYSDDSDYTGRTSIAGFYYGKAVKTANSVIKNGAASGYGMMDDYEQIFRVQNNNCKEILFALQFVPGNTTTGLGNDMQGYLCYDNCLDNRYGQAYSTWASYDYLYVASHRGGLNRTRGNVMPNNMTYDYLYHESDTCSTPGIVWTVKGRKILPIKKQVVGGPVATNNMSFNGNSGFDTPLLRMSEVYLNLTEAIMGQQGVSETSDATVLEGINAVRRRAYQYEITNGGYPGDYKVVNLDTLLQERRMEFYMEGLNWTDIVRRSFMSEQDMKHMLDYCNNKLEEQEGDSIMGCHRLYGYQYTADADLHKIGTVKLSTTNGSYSISRISKECIHSIASGNYCHTQNVGEGDNLWSMIYPPTESIQDVNLLKAPIKFDFSTIINNKNQYHE